MSIRLHVEETTVFRDDVIQRAKDIIETRLKTLAESEDKKTEQQALAEIEEVVQTMREVLKFAIQKKPGT